jgi:hypothetical protein
MRPPAFVQNKLFEQYFSTNLYKFHLVSSPFKMVVRGRSRRNLTVDLKLPSLKQEMHCAARSAKLMSISDIECFTPRILTIILVPLLYVLVHLLLVLPFFVVGPARHTYTKWCHINLFILFLLYVCVGGFVLKKYLGSGARPFLYYAYVCVYSMIHSPLALFVSNILNSFEPHISSLCMFGYLIFVQFIVFTNISEEMLGFDTRKGVIGRVIVFVLCGASIMSFSMSFRNLKLV